MLIPMPPALPVVATLHQGASQRSPVVAVGWNDEMETVSAWRDLPGGNRPQVWRREEGGLALRLPQVPDRWPYEYQWSGVTREAIVDLGKYPVLLANVGAVGPGYAHLEIEERDVNGKAVRGWRTPTRTDAGLIKLDLGDAAKNVRRLYLRLIVGGPNEGASVAYRWVRFVSHEGAALIEANPNVRVRFVP